MFIFFLFCLRAAASDATTHAHDDPDAHPQTHSSTRKKKTNRQRSYVVYPPEGPRPPSPETVHSIARDNAGRK